ncbi:nuclear transport factor 2 family protein [Nocardioides sp. LMS-CY]|uniref:Ketosteroid isomerase-like protein n=1 Tax=Nocardioides soli TaxID=1036020 RepID=A0A7W4VZL1_9ACTN|nr:MULTISPECIES: nuclear transport factor 2 family protein [Nocardioides]MBB3044707.1 ketosteroid isomerase-like protein [Nocardioides soli]QWF20029.1 nuclear transport factor 2 family protein [Nocardioides sp. LMS-CY]
MSSDGKTPEKVTFDGGTEAEQQELLRAFQDFWTANDVLDIPRLKELWRDSDDYVYFNSNGFTYNGFQDWLGVWRYYGPRFDLIEPARLGNVKVMIRGDMAVLTDDRVQIHREPKNQGPILGRHITGRPVMRGTMVYTRESDGWKCVHAHYSPSELEGERPWAPPQD